MKEFEKTEDYNLIYEAYVSETVTGVPMPGNPNDLNIILATIIDKLKKTNGSISETKALMEQEGYPVDERLIKRVASAAQIEFRGALIHSESSDSPETRCASEQHIGILVGHQRHLVAAIDELSSHVLRAIVLGTASPRRVSGGFAAASARYVPANTRRIVGGPRPYFSVITRDRLDLFPMRTARSTQNSMPKESLSSDLTEVLVPLGLQTNALFRVLPRGSTQRQ